MGKEHRASVGIRSGFALLALTGGLALAAPASAATIEVPKDFKTIQEAVDNADPGDTVAVSKKTNIENVEVPVQNLKIKGVAKGVVIDGYDETNGNDYNVEALADGVKVQNVELRNGSGFRCAGFDRCGATRVSWTGEGETDCFVATGDKASVKSSKMRGCGSAGVDISGNEAKISKTTITRTDSGCIDVTGDDAVITANKLSSCEDDDGINVSGVNARIEKNVVSRVDGNFVQVSGADATVLDNRGTAAYDYCYDINSDGAEVTGNAGRFCDGYGIYASGVDNVKVLDNTISDVNDYGLYVGGQNPKVNSNSVARTNGAGIDFSCNVTCDNASLSGNTVRDNVQDSYGLDVSVTSGTGSVDIVGNKILNATDNGMSLSLSGGKIKDNLIKGAGSEGESGLDLSGSENTVSGNSAISGSGDGFEISGTGNELTDNVARDNDGDGFYVVSGAIGAELVSNTAVRNKADGFENDGTNTVFKQNEASGNRRDCANDGTIATDKKNNCADGSDFDEPGTASRKRS